MIESGFELRQFFEVLTEARVLGFDLFAELPESCVDLVGRGRAAGSGLSGMMFTAFAILRSRWFDGLLLAALFVVRAAAFLVFRRVLTGVLVIVAAPL